MSEKVRERGRERETEIGLGVPPRSRSRCSGDARSAGCCSRGWTSPERASESVVLRVALRGRPRSLRITRHRLGATHRLFFVGGAFLQHDAVLAIELLAVPLLAKESLELPRSAAGVPLSSRRLAAHTPSTGAACDRWPAGRHVRSRFGARFGEGANEMCTFGVDGRMQQCGHGCMMVP